MNPVDAAALEDAVVVVVGAVEPVAEVVVEVTVVDAEVRFFADFIWIAIA